MYCESDKSVVKKGFNQLKNGTRLQRYLCGSPDQRVIIKTYVEKQAKNRRRIFSKLRNP